MVLTKLDYSLRAHCITCAYEVTEHKPYENFGEISNSLAMPISRVDAEVCGKDDVRLCGLWLITCAAPVTNVLETAVGCIVHVCSTSISMSDAATDPKTYTGNTVRMKSDGKNNAPGR
jgi:uncharacterized protein YqkB